eukprot:3318582-Heterocapsa_arctica.AAC.1
MLMQEHWRLKEDVKRWESIAAKKGWQVVWEPAMITAKDKDGITGRLVLNNEFEADYRAIGASLGWGRKKSLHIFAIYGYDIGQKDQQGQSYHERGNRSIRDRLGKFISQLGRVPWIIGGDWNMAPGVCTIEALKSSAAYIDPIEGTWSHRQHT